MDEITFKQLKDSKYYHPEITEVMFDSRMMLEMVLDSFNIAEKGFNAVWDPIMCSFVSNYFKEGIHLLEKQTKEKDIKLRVIVEITKENIEFIESLKHHEIRHLDGIRSNFGIFDNRAYMVYIFHRESDKPDQTYWSNSKVLVDKQNILFSKLWNMAIPLSDRKKEIEYQSSPNYQKTISNYNELINEVIFLIGQTRRELLIFTSTKMLTRYTDNDNFMSKLSIGLKRGITIKLLTDDTSEHFLKQIAELGIASKYNQINFGYSNKLGDIHEMVIIADSTIMLRIKDDIIHDTSALLSSEEQSVLVQEILFEKYWNEIQSLEIAQSN